MPQFRIRVNSPSLGFCAAHFITLDATQCESLHGHNFRLAAEIEGPLNADQYVVDFLAVENALRAIAAGLDHRVLLPLQHPTLAVIADSSEVNVTWNRRRWVFPLQDCVLLPVANTTAELLAALVMRELRERLAAAGADVRSLRMAVEVQEGDGFSAVCEVPPESVA